MEKDLTIKGGEFLLRKTKANEVFIPEEFDEEQLMIAQTCDDFLETEVFPNLDRIDSQEEGLMRSILEKAGELGLLGVSIEEEYDGFGQSFVTSMLSSERMGAGNSFAVAFSAHTGIGSLPIAYYGNHEQKQKYLTKLATGEWAGAYCLTEPGAGSDANSGKTKAVLSEDGKHYILNGQKMWITNGGFADVQTVFAKIDNDRVYSAFIVEKAWDGIVLNPEEKKMGIKGSSTRQIFYNDVKVPVENLLGKRGEGFRIALNILHMGRIKLGGNVLGAAKRAISQSVNYANERKQFGTLIANFGAIKFKIAEQAIKTFTTECAVYRVSKDIDNAIEINKAEEGCDYGRAVMGAFGEYGAEAAIMKVFGSEALDYVVDEMVQIMGGMGFSAEMPADKAYRDSRINRIFEGTNEVNRIIVSDTIIKRGQKNHIPLFEKAKEIIAGLDNLNNSFESKGYYEDKSFFVENFKNVAVMLMEVAVNKFDRKLVHEQEVLNSISDILMNVYVAESTMLRIQKAESVQPEEIINLYKDMLDVYIFETASLINKHALDAIYSIDDEELTDKLLKGTQIYTKVAGVNVKDARRRIADKIIEENRYCF
ncbi:MAG: acyl-CoA dehydrogenase family protein [Bacteroidales bacterium]|jgi:alkylation response protein AidB-like acyl-CoA dehydrogenase|nr:acyl-CoA dehydrogenase family protein [Bacteroidales bacterium]